MTHAKKLLSLLLVLALVLSLAPMAFAADGDETEAEAQTVEETSVETTEEAAEAEAPVEEEAAEPVEIAEDAEDEAEPVELDLEDAPLVGDVAMTGSCGDSLNWALTENGTETVDDVSYKNYTLTLTGTGAMDDYEDIQPDGVDYTIPNSPWRIALFQLDTTEEPEYIHTINNIVIPSGVTYIGAHAFQEFRFTSITIPDTVTEMGAYAMGGCPVLSEVTLSANLTNIPDWCFRSCPVLTTISIPDSVITIGYRAFMPCSLLAFTLNAATSKLETIGEDAFRQSGLTSIVLPAGVSQIGTSAFSGCGSLVSADLSACTSLKTIENYVFNGDAALVSVKLPDSVETLGSSVFSGASSLETFRFPRALTSIGSTCFNNTTSLHSVDATALSSPLENSTNAFKGTQYSNNGVGAIIYAKSTAIRSSFNNYSSAVTAIVADPHYLDGVTLAAYTLVTPTYGPADQVFAGWNKAAAGTGKVYSGTLARGDVWYACFNTPVGGSVLQSWLSGRISALSAATTVSLSDYTGSLDASGVLTLLNTGDYLVTVDLAGKTVTATGLAVFGKVAIIDSVGGGGIAVPQNRIYLTATNGSSAGAGYLPVWDPADSGAYRFCNITLSSSANNTNNGTLAQYGEQLGYTGTSGAALRTLLAGSNSANTGVTVLFRMTWTTEYGEANQEFAFNNAQTKIAAVNANDETLSRWFVLNINGAKSLTTTDSQLKVTPILRFSGSCVTEIQGTEYTLDLTT